MNHIRLADDTRLAYRLTGRDSGPTVVLCDGISCDGYAWRYLRPWLNQRFRVLHVQYRGHGQSGIPRDQAAVTLAHLARDLDEVMSALELSDATLIGHSMGVQVILEVAFRYPSRVRAGVLLCGSGGRVLDTFKESDIGARILPRVRALTDRHREWVARALRAVMPTELAYVVARQTEFNKDLVRREDFMPYLEHFATMPPDLFTRMLEDAAWRTAYPFLRSLTQPMLMVAGERDGFTPARMCRKLAQALPDCDYHLIRGGSHTAPIEVPEAIEGMVDAFFERIGVLSDADAAPPAPRAAPLAHALRDGARTRRRRTASPAAG